MKSENWKRIRFVTKKALTLCGVLGLCVPSLAFSETKPPPSSSWTIYVDDEATITGFAWKSEPHPVEARIIEGRRRYVVRLSGTFRQKNSSLLIDNRPIRVAPDGAFNFLLEVQEKDKVTGVTAVDPLGNIQKERIIVKFIPPPPPAEALLPSSRTPKTNYSSTAGISLSSISYSQTGLTSFKEFALTGKVGVRYATPPSRWDFAGSIFFTALPFATNSPEKVTLSFFGFNARTGYELPWLKRPWKLTFMTGIYFTSANAKGGSDLETNLGYSVSGIQLFTTLSRSFRRGDSLGFYTKFSPLSDKIGFALSSSEIALGTSYLFVPNPEGQGFGVNLDYSNLNLTLGELAVKTTSISLGVSYRL